MNRRLLLAIVVPFFAAGFSLPTNAQQTRGDFPLIPQPVCSGNSLPEVIQLTGCFRIDENPLVGVFISNYTDETVEFEIVDSSGILLRRVEELSPDEARLFYFEKGTLIIHDGNPVKTGIQAHELVIESDKSLSFSNQKGLLILQ